MRPSTFLTFALAALATAQTNIVSEDVPFATIIESIPSTTDSPPSATPVTSLLFESVEPTGILVDTGVPEIPGTTSALATFVSSSSVTTSAVGSVGTGVSGGVGAGAGGVGLNGTSSHGGRPSATGTAPISGSERVGAVGGVLGVVVGVMMMMMMMV